MALFVITESGRGSCSTHGALEVDLGRELVPALVGETHPRRATLDDTPGGDDSWNTLIYLGCPWIVQKGVGLDGRVWPQWRVEELIHVRDIGSAVTRAGCNKSLSLRGAGGRQRMHAELLETQHLLLVRDCPEQRAHWQVRGYIDRRRIGRVRADQAQNTGYGYAAEYPPYNCVCKNIMYVHGVLS